MVERLLSPRLADIVQAIERVRLILTGREELTTALACEEERPRVTQEYLDATANWSAFEACLTAAL
jgi:hypothetical protein